MSSTRVISHEFDCLRPKTLEEALRALQEEGAWVLAGGTDLVNAIKTDLVRPRLLVYALGIEELAALRWEDGRPAGQAPLGIQAAGGAPDILSAGLSIGAAVRLRTLELDGRVRARWPALAEAVEAIGGTQVRNMATLAGNLCNASPGADTPPVLLALGAQAEVASLGGGAGDGPPGGGSPGPRRPPQGRPQRRLLPLERFFTGPKRTVLRRGQMLAAVRLPEPAAHSGAAFRRLARVSLDIAKINCAAWLQRDGQRIAAARVALGSVAPTPVRAAAVEGALVGRPGGRELFRRAAERVGEDIAPISDVRSTDAYRRQMAVVLVGEALEEAWRRANAC